MRPSRPRLRRSGHSIAGPNSPAASTPTLVLVGAEDASTPPRQSVEIAQCIRHANLEVLPRGGHGMLLEYPDPTLGAINSFLERHLPASSSEGAPR